MIDLTDCIPIGTIIKSHGIRGQVVLRLDYLEFSDIIKMETVFIEIDGLPVPFFVSEYYEKDTHQLVVSFEDFDAKNCIDDLMESRVFISAQYIHTKIALKESPETLIGYEVHDILHGKLGIVNELIPSANNPLFRICSKKKEILFPVQPAFIVEIDKSNKIIHVQAPDGLIDLN
jgi:16S rRNA processing protein RimM